MHLLIIIVFGFVLANQLNGENLENAINGQFPPLVALLDEKMNYVAPAALLTVYHVFSAARWHVPGKALMALAGDISLSRTDTESRQLRSIVNTTVHPNYENTKDPNFDVALYVVSEMFQWLTSVFPYLHCSYPPHVWETCVSVGWGLASDISNRKPNSSTLFNNTNGSLSIKPSNVLLYQEFEIAPQKDCNQISRTQGICGRDYSGENLAIEYGGPVICSKMLCGIFVNTPRHGPSTVSFRFIELFEDWIYKEINSFASRLH